MVKHWTMQRELRLYLAILIKVPPHQLTWDNPEDKSMFDEILASQDQLWINTPQNQILEKYSTATIIHVLYHIVTSAQVPCYSTGVEEKNWWNSLSKDLKSKTAQEFGYTGHNCWERYNAAKVHSGFSSGYYTLRNPQRVVCIRNQSINVGQLGRNSSKKVQQSAQPRCSSKSFKDLDGITAMNRLCLESDQNPPKPHKGDWSFSKTQRTNRDQRTIFKNTATLIYNQPAEYTTSDSDSGTTSDSDSDSGTTSDSDSDSETTSESDSNPKTTSDYNSSSVTRLSCGTTSAAESDSEDTSVSGYSAGQSGSVASLDNDSFSSYTTTVSDSDNNSVTASISNITGTAIDLADRVSTDTEMLDIDPYTYSSSVCDPADPYACSSFVCDPADPQTSILPARSSQAVEVKFNMSINAGPNTQISTGSHSGTINKPQANTTQANTTRANKTNTPWVFPILSEDLTIHIYQTSLRVVNRLRGNTQVLLDYINKSIAKSEDREIVDYRITTGVVLPSGNVLLKASNLQELEALTYTTVPWIKVLGSNATIHFHEYPVSIFDMDIRHIGNPVNKQELLVKKIKTTNLKSLAATPADIIHVGWTKPWKKVKWEKKSRCFIIIFNSLSAANAILQKGLIFGNKCYKTAYCHPLEQDPDCKGCSHYLNSKHFLRNFDLGNLERLTKRVFGAISEQDKLQHTCDSSTFIKQKAAQDRKRRRNSLFRSSVLPQPGQTQIPTTPTVEDNKIDKSGRSKRLKRK
ncbi:hypothetical protein BP00DRAFT_72282 [Aspergillus indologenus CBS 114.80]|uniref:Uncharacterized protein n=1 Tax=Aspergillus indologenus CBS 114.80 TaxID=1450541 RepID=A0A2V5ICE4_9EURO|nr:hypothetical protein BP00DRAFT_72282 [Aspergillus indologenus CBS 114.80]